MPIHAEGNAQLPSQPLASTSPILRELTAGADVRAAIRHSFKLSQMQQRKSFVCGSAPTFVLLLRASIWLALPWKFS